MNILECRGLTKSYRRGTPVLSDFNIDIPAGRIIGLLGPNGCGKSTLIKLVAGLLQPDSGSITVGGHPVGEKSKALIITIYFPPKKESITLLNV